MGHLNFDKGNGKKKGWSGFIVALAVCLVAVGGVATAGFLGRLSTDDPDSSASSPVSSRTTTTTSPETPVGQAVSGVPDDRATTTAPPESSAGGADAASAESSGTGAADLFVLPLTNEVIRQFSNAAPVYSPTMGDWRAHNGVDFRGKENQQVKALADGTVSSVKEGDVMWGNILEIDHGYGIVSRYCGVKASVREGQTVKVGDLVGSLSGVPCEEADGPHLHLEILVNGSYVNPVEAIGRDVKYADTESAASAS